MKIGLIDVDGHGFPNLALMKIKRFYGNCCEWYTGIEHYDKIYLSKVFTFTPDYDFAINADEIIRGGTGYNSTAVLPSGIDRLQPDYNLYGIDKKTAFGFLSRGCCNKCKWCIVPKKEGYFMPYMDVEEIAIEGRNKLILMDNNILAGDYGFCQLEKIIKNNYKVDFNQGLDARKIDMETAKILASVKWLKYIRLACDTSSVLRQCQTAIDNLRAAGYKGFIFVYTLINPDFAEAYQRVLHFRNQHYVVPFAQPYRDFTGKTQPPQWQKDFAHWVNKRSAFLSVDFEDFQPRKGFKCSEYFKLFNFKS